jgi:excisionase family DNA binding protein
MTHTLLFENQLLTTKGAAQHLKVSESLVRKMRARGDLPFVTIGRAVRFRLSTLNKWIERRETVSAT